MKHLLLVCALVLAVSATGVSQEKKAYGEKAKEEAKAMTVSGYVVDAMCAKGMAGKETTMKKAMSHTKGCALEEECASSGFGVFSEGKWYKFDEKGDKEVQKLIEDSSTERGMKVEVTGTMKGQTLAVASIKEQKAEQKKTDSAK
ncbi:MAG: hypothetical protein OEM41_03325 [Ignavibacteria bacterium]|nr:hypothetical protein [Ignavibacteria bacterium]